VYCKGCCTLIGWKYVCTAIGVICAFVLMFVTVFQEWAKEEDQKYKEGMYVVEKSFIEKVCVMVVVVLWVIFFVICCLCYRLVKTRLGT